MENISGKIFQKIFQKFSKKNTMASKNKSKNKTRISKKQQKSEALFNAMVSCCQAPWVSSMKELPEYNRLVQICYYTGERKSSPNKDRKDSDSLEGYTVATAVRIKLNHTATKRKFNYDVYDDDRSANHKNIEELLWYDTSKEYTACYKDIAANTGGIYMYKGQDQNYCNGNKYNSCMDGTMSKDKHREALKEREDIWLIFKPGGVPEIFYNSKAPLGQFCTTTDDVKKLFDTRNVFVGIINDLGKTSLNAYVPEFWMYVPGVK